MAIDTLIQAALYLITGSFFVRAAPWVLGLRFSSPPGGPGDGGVHPVCDLLGIFRLLRNLWKGQTPGKRYAGIRVIKESGRPINAFEAIGRNLMRAVDGLPGIYGVGLVCMMCNRQSRRLGDFVAGTVVVHEKADRGSAALVEYLGSRNRPSRA
jgi:uncharacterized RDD family membrane protein YckC